MIRRRLPLLAALALTACAPAPGTGPAERAVREYIALRNAGDLPGLLAKSCGRLYTATSGLLAQSADRQREISASMREHPVDVEAVAAEPAGEHVYSATLTGSARTPRGREIASQRAEVRQYRDGYRVCALDP